MEVSAQLNIPAALSRRKMLPLRSGPHSRSGRGGEEKQITAHAGNRIQVAQTVAWSINRLNCAGSTWKWQY